MGAFVADATIKELIKAGKAPKNCKIAIFGLTFKENCPDIRNSKVDDIIKRLKEYDIQPVVVDPWADAAEAKREYHVELVTLDQVKDADCIILAVAHNQFKTLTLDELKKMFRSEEDSKKVLIDVKGLHSVEALNASGMSWWRL